MRKNKMMRTAAVLGVAALLTTSALSGTLAKYTTTAEGSDSARVAKWGITMSSTGSSTFSDTYDAIQEATVKGENSAKVVAPGTHGSATYKVSGTPETAYKITFTGTKNDDVYLAKDLKFKYVAPTDSTNKDAAYSAPDKSEETTVSANYYPVNYSIKISGPSTGAEIGKVSTTGGTTSIEKLNEEQTFETLEEAMAALSNTKVTYSTPNTEADLTVEFKWAWAFGDETTESDKTNDNVISVKGHNSNDAYDTVLGDIAAKNTDLIVGETTGTSLEPTVKDSYDTKIGYKLEMTATQID